MEETQAIKTWAVTAVRYIAGIAGIVDWIADELKAMNRKTSKLRTMNSSLHPRADVDRLTQRNGGRGWMSVDDVERVKEHSLSDYVKGAEVNSDMMLDVFAKEKGKQELITEQKKMKLDGWRDKPTTTWVVSIKRQ